MKANRQRLINDPIWILRNQIIRLASLLSLAVSVLSISVSDAEKVIISDKTLVAWATPANLDQRGGSVLTIEKSGGVFDAIVFGEIATSKWMPGSNNYHRTKKDQADFPSENELNDSPVQITIVYQGKQITLYRNGKMTATYDAQSFERFGEGSMVLMGLRHVDAMPNNRFFTGSIDDVRIYNIALDARQVESLKPNRASTPSPLAWWDFEDGRAIDRMMTFPVTTLIGDVRITEGKLHLDKKGGYVLASKAVGKTDKGGLDLSDVNSSTRSLREKLLSDPYRPGYHFVAPEGLCMPFDPNGAIFWKGRYHLFYIFQDARGHNWGHASSTDLFHWRHHPTGLVAGMFSGNCFLNKEGVPTMCYHQVGQGNAMAIALDDDLNEWEKLETNPITPKTKAGDLHHDKYRSWDPFGWFEGGNYYAIFGGKRPAIAKANSLAGPWNYVGDLLANTVDGVSINEDVSCADLFKIGDKHMLLCISHTLGCRYYLGDWKGEQFHPTSHEQMSWMDNSFFAPESLLDDQGRRIMWAWIKDRPTFKTRHEGGWSGTMSLPRILSIDDQGLLCINLPQEIEHLRYNQRTENDLEVKDGDELVLKGISGNSLELSLEIDMGNASQVGVKVCRSPDGEEQTPVYFDANDKKLKVDTQKSGHTEGTKSIEAGPLVLGEKERLKLRIFVDKSVVEVFANGRQAVMRRIYPSRADSIGISLFANGGPATVKMLRAWDMMPSNPY